MINDAIVLYKQQRNKHIYSLSVLSVFILFIIAASLKLGAISFSWQELLHDNLAQKVLLELRLPRILSVILIGGALALSGVVMQGLFRNPMADPALIGMSSGAALFAMSFILLTHNMINLPLWFSNWGMTICAFIGSLLVTLITYSLSIKKGQSHVSILILAGVAINALCGSLTGLLSYLANDNVLRSITFWSMGSFSNSNYATVISMGASIIVSSVLLKNTSRFLNAMIIGEAYALSVGINIKKEKHKAIIAIALLVGTATAFAGPIGFIGLLVPHIMRLIVGYEHRHLFFTSVLYGALILAIADIVAKIIAAPSEVPIGIITALIGTPYFIYLLFKQKLAGNL